jgi:TIR domain
MPFTDTASIKIFISYASDDERIAEVLARTLRATFVNSIEITMMSDFPAGVNWRRLIDSSISQTDLLIAIASGRLRPSHSWTGFEIGSFSFSTGIAPKMKRYQHLDRLMIPFAVLERMPSTLNEFEGIDIDRDALRDIRFDPLNLPNELNGRVRPDGPHKKIVSMLADLDNVVNRAGFEGSGSDIRLQRERYDTLEKNAQALYLDVLGLMLSREMSVDYPKTKLIIRTQPSLQSGGVFDPVETAIIRIEGNGHEVFGLPEPHDQPIKWSELTSRADEDIAFQWRKALTSLMSSSKGSNFIDDNSIISFNRKKVFRIFTAAVTSYYSSEIEYQVYAVEILRHRDYGDPDTTLLLKALEISLAYRFMFLEDTSEFSPSIFRATRLDKLQGRASDLVDQLNLLLLTADQYELGEPKNIIKILGIPTSNEIDDKFRQWDKEKESLYQATRKLLTLKSVDYSDSSEYVGKVQAFCQHTRQMNESYTAAVLEELDKRLEAQKLRTVVSEPVAIRPAVWSR